MKKFKRVLSRFINVIASSYDMDMNLIEGVNHREFNIKRSFKKPSSKEYHLYHIMPLK